MGLGPPVCMTCRRVFDHLTVDEQKELVKTYPKIGFWWCSKCKSSDTKVHAFMLTKSEFDEIFPDTNSSFKPLS
jgi:hypothetical protein